jgi:erythromycin esterase
MCGLPRIALATVLLLLALEVGAIRGQESERIRSELQYAYDRMAAAFANKDVAGVTAFYAPDARFVDTEGLESGLARGAADVERVIRELKAIGSVQIALDSVSLQGNEVVAVARLNVAGTAKLISFEYPLRLERAVRASWITTDRGWRIRHEITLQEKQWADDKLIEDRAFDPPPSAALRATIVQEIASQAKALDSVDPGSGFDDLAEFDRIVGDARIVSLGEASHGTAEFFRMKHRLLEYLVEKKGFTVLAIESGWPRLEAVDRYIKSGEGDAAAAVRALTWQTREVRALVTWMAAYNKALGGRAALSFSGFDMQGQVGTAKKCAIDVFSRLGEAEREAIGRLYEGAERLDEDYDKPVPAGEKESLCRNSARAVELFDEKREAMANVATPLERTIARQCARVVQQACDLSVTAAASFFGGSGVRDRMMAENVRWLIENVYPGQKIALWAHNGHVGTAPANGSKSMGSYLREVFGNEMVVVAFALERGAIRAQAIKDGKMRPPGEVKLTHAHPHSLDALFASTGMARFVLDFRQVSPSSALGRWLARPRMIREPGWTYDLDNEWDGYERKILPASYDCIIFVAESSATRPLDP